MTNAFLMIIKNRLIVYTGARIEMVRAFAISKNERKVFKNEKQNDYRHRLYGACGCHDLFCLSACKQTDQ